MSKIIFSFINLGSISDASDIGASRLKGLNTGQSDLDVDSP